MKRKTMVGKMGLARWVFVGAGMFLTGCQLLLEVDWDEFAYASGGTGAMGAGGGGGACVAGGMAGAGKSCDGASNQSCGTSGTCCDSVLVPAGSDTSCPEIKPFYLDVYEVSVGRFRKWVEAPDGFAMHTPPMELAATWATSVSDLETKLQSCPDSTYGLGKDNLPINCVMWAEADAFCQWDAPKGRLPTVGELRRAAHGCSSWAFPWGNMPSPDSDHATFMPESIGLVGSKEAGKGAFGHFNLVGNVREWVQCDGACNCTPLPFSTSANQKTFGGSNQSVALSLEIENSLGSQDPKIRPHPTGFGETGFRCARDL